jgi:hypothetical protein
MSGGKYVVGRGLYEASEATEINIPLPIYVDENQRFLEENVHGGLVSLATGQPLDSVPTDISVTQGTGKILVAVNAGSDTSGEITVTGTTVNRDTGVETGADTDTLTIDGLTTDGSDTDADGNTRHSFTKAYMTSKWFKGSVTLSTTNLTLTDVDVYHCSFEQWNDQSEIELDTLDINAVANNTSAWLYAYLYTVVPDGDEVDITRVASIDLPAAEITAANLMWRLRRSNIGITINGATDGFFVDLHLGPNSQEYWQDLSMKVWGINRIPSSALAVAPPTDHGTLSGLGDDDHGQYLKEKASGGAASEIPTHTHQSAAEAGQLDHGAALTGLTDDDHSGHPWLVGRSGGQTLQGGTDAGDDLTLQSTSNATKGNVHLGTASTYDEVNDRLGIGTQSPDAPIKAYRSGANAKVETERASGAINFLNSTATVGNFGTGNAFPFRLAVDAAGSGGWFFRADTDFQTWWRLPNLSTAGRTTWAYAAIDGTARTIIANASGTDRDVVTTCLITWVAEENTAGTTANGATRVDNGGNANITVGALTLQFAVAANGALTIQRTAGANSCDLVCDVLFF